MRKVDVMIIDDSAIVREILEKALKEDSRFGNVRTAVDPYIARQKLAKQSTDVIVLDIEMPRMDGLTFLKHLMSSYPLPVIILSSLTDTKNEASLEALNWGALDIVPKPGGPYSVGEVIGSLVDKILAVSQVDRNRIRENLPSSTVEEADRKVVLSRIETTKKMIVIGASTGGPQALEKVIRALPSNFPPTLVVIHMPEKFTRSFAERLNSLSRVEVKEAVNNERAKVGYVYVAPGNYHLQIKTVGTEYVLKVVTGPRINKHRPSVDVLFDSAAKYLGKNCLGVLLTGMGRDGAEGLLKIRNAGGYTIAQDEKSSIVFGMPKEAIDLGGASEVVSLDRISERLTAMLLP